MYHTKHSQDPKQTAELARIAVADLIDAGTDPLLIQAVMQESTGAEFDDEPETYDGTTTVHDDEFFYFGS